MPGRSLPKLLRGISSHRYQAAGTGLLILISTPCRHKLSTSMWRLLGQSGGRWDHLHRSLCWHAVLRPSSRRPLSLATRSAGLLLDMYRQLTRKSPSTDVGLGYDYSIARPIECGVHRHPGLSADRELWQASSVKAIFTLMAPASMPPQHMRSTVSAVAQYPSGLILEWDYRLRRQWPYR